jgi:phosphonate transport system substrate-binding protein
MGGKSHVSLGIGIGLASILGMGIAPQFGSKSLIPGFFSLPAAQSQTTAKPKITIAFATRKGVVDLDKHADAVAKLLATETKTTVEAIVSDETAAVEALRANKVDVAFLGSRAALKAEQLAGAKMLLAEVRDNYSGGKTYKSIFVVRNDSPLKSQGSAQATLSQLKGKRMAFASRTSGSGFVVPTGELVNRKLVDSPDRYEQFFSQVFYGDGYSSALQAVLRNQSDVAAVSEYALLPPWITEAEGKQLRVLYSIPGVPAHGIVFDDDIPKPQQDSLVSAFLKLNQPNHNAMLVSLYNSTKLVRVDHNQHLQLMRTALKNAKLEP